MVERTKDNTDTRPRVPVRRFDVFAEFCKLKAIEQGMAEGEAKGYGLWVAKVVASRGSGGGATRQAATGYAKQPPDEPQETVWHELNGEPQTDERFHKEIIQRMGQEFYERVFAPAIRQAYESGRSYQSIRDMVRRDWKP